MMRCILLLVLFVASASGSKVFKYKVIKEFPHDESAFTEGLTFRDSDGTLLESTGLSGQSVIQEYTPDLTTGTLKAGKKFSLPNKHFGEGITFFEGKLFSLTWKSGTVHVYDAYTLEEQQVLQLDSRIHEGWGLALTSNKDALLASDGSAVLHKLRQEGSELRIVDNIHVHDCSKGISQVAGINELELIPRSVTHPEDAQQRIVGAPAGAEEVRRKEAKDTIPSRDLIWANIITTMCVAAINPSSGEVEAWILLDGIYDKWDRFNKVANGVAYRAADQTLWLTGKDWSKLFLIELEQVMDNKVDIASHCKSAWRFNFDLTSVPGYNPKPCS